MAEVDAWFAKYDNPMKPVVQRIREIILGADPRMTECIKWQAPTFVYEGNLASFFPKAKEHASLMFHQGAKIPGEHSILEAVKGNTGKIIKIATVEAADAAKAEIEAVVKAWIDWRDGDAKPAKTTGATTPSTKTKRAAKPSAALKAKPTAKAKAPTKAKPKAKARPAPRSRAKAKPKRK
jgi:hypothetical protein